MRAIYCKHLATAFPGLAPRRCARALLFAGAALVVGLASVAGLAEEQKAGRCSEFCLPIAAKDLAGQRAQGLDPNATKLGVILWDELRQQGAPPPPPNNAGMSDGLSISGPGNTTLVSANYRLR